MSALLDEVAESLSWPSPTQARAIREAAGVTRDRLAAELQINPLTLWRWETAAVTPRPAHRRAWARLLRQLDALVHAAHQAAA